MEEGDHVKSNTGPEIEKLRLDRDRYRMDLLKWVIVAVGAVISFAIIDLGKLRLEQFRVAAEDRRELLSSYLSATDAPEPDVWKRKLNLILSSSVDDETLSWARRELDFVENYAELETLYRETLKVASQLVEPSRVNEPDRVQARARYNQLYWADLPYAGESQEVISAMIAFRDQLISTENAGSESTKHWEDLNRKLIELSQALRNSSPNKRMESND